MIRLAARSSAARSIAAGGALVLTLTLAACGSQLDPDQVAGQTGGGGTTAQGGEIVPGAPTSSGADIAAGGTTGDTTTGGGAPVGGAPAGGDTSGGGAAGGDEAGGGGGGGHGSGDNAAGGGGAAASCDGFKNGPGVTDSEITIGNAADVSGPVPGLFSSSQDAVKAYVAYFNSTSDICGRKLKLATYDTRTDAGADQQAYAKGCDEVFAMVGSMGAFDSGGAAHCPVVRPARPPRRRRSPRTATRARPASPPCRSTPVSGRTRPASSSRPATRTRPPTPG